MRRGGGTNITKTYVEKSFVPFWWKLNNQKTKQNLFYRGTYWKDGALTRPTRPFPATSGTRCQNRSKRHIKQSFIWQYNMKYILYWCGRLFNVILQAFDQQTPNILSIQKIHFSNTNRIFFWKEKHNNSLDSFCTVHSSFVSFYFSYCLVSCSSYSTGTSLLIWKILNSFLLVFRFVPCTSTSHLVCTSTANVLFSFLYSFVLFFIQVLLI